MCGVLDDLLPVIGGVVGFAAGGPWGAAIGGALGGAGGNYAQTHSLTGALEGAVTGGVGGYFGGGSLANALGGLGSAGVGAGTAAFDTGLAGSVAPTTLGGLESGAGGAGLFGVGAGTGTAIGDAAGALGGSGLGIAGGDALSGISGASGSFLGALGGGTQGTGLGVGGQASSVADLSGATNVASTGSAGATQTTGLTQSPVANLSQTTSGVGVTTPTGTPPTTPTANALEGSQAATTGSGAPVAFDSNGASALEGSQVAQAGGGQQGALAAMYGPNSTAAGSAVGQGISSTTGDVANANSVQYGALGEGTPSAPGIAGNLNSATATGAKAVNDTDLANYGALMKLFNTGVGAYQQYAKQNAYNNYVNQINNEFSPNSAYAQQMQQTLARQDAAAGRNSQYGNRAVQLAAALTQARAQALGNSNYFNASTATPGASMLNGLFSNFASPQGIQAAQSLYNMGSSGLNSLSNLFGG